MIVGLVTLLTLTALNSFAGGKGSYQNHHNGNVKLRTDKKAREKHFNLNAGSLDFLFKELANRNVNNLEELTRYFGVMMMFDFPCKLSKNQKGLKRVYANEAAREFVETYQNADYETIKRSYKRFTRHHLKKHC